MAHIANCIADLESGHITKLASPQPPYHDSRTPTAGPAEKPFTWRMQQPDPPQQQQRKYQLFPKERQLPILNSGKSLDPEKAFAVAMSHDTTKHEKPSAAAGLRIRINQHKSIRRRKISVPELGPMTTVQEMPMDSPTIPGRPPLHERSISAPGNPRQHQLADTFLSETTDDESNDFLAEVEEALESAKIVASPKQLAPLVIPKSDSAFRQPREQRSLNHLHTNSDGSRSGRFDDSPKNRTPLITPNTSYSDLTTPKSASTLATPVTTLPTPVSAPIMENNKSSPKPWDGRSTTPVTSEAANSSTENRSGTAHGHRRGASESSSIMDRGRPRKRVDVRNNNGPLLKRADSKRNKSADRRAFEQLPQGLKPTDATDKFEASELARIQKQAFGQAQRFEVLRAEDIESLSKELRHLDERTDYLRRTYNSLRAGRRNLHSRICQYLRSPRVIKFSQESMLKQEEALAELDASIDDWVTKLEQAENRRTRVRQKLLEHVAAAAILPSGGAAVASETLHQAMGLNSSSGVGNISTPPRSPSKQSFSPTHSVSNSPSPQRVVAQVPSTILEQPLVEEAAALDEEKDERAMSAMSASLKRGDVESIRIYAGEDVYALLADVENEISKMSSHHNASEAASAPNMAESERMELHRQRSHEILNGRSDSSTLLSTSHKKDLNTVAPLSPPAPTPPMKDSSLDALAPIMLTSAVFKG